MGGEIVFILIVLFTIIRSLFLFFRWAMRGLQRLGAPGSAYAPSATPLQEAASVRTPLQSQRPITSPSQTDPLSSARRTDAGGPVVTREATSASFRAEEGQLLRSQPQSAFAITPNDSSPESPSDVPLFQTPGDFIRAFILQEALGPPLSRRPRH